MIRPPKKGGIKYQGSFVGVSMETEILLIARHSTILHVPIFQAGKA